MSIDYKITAHASAFPTKMLAQNGGKHIYNIEISEDRDNGNVVAKDAWKGMEYYSDKASTGVTGVILEQASNGNWYVEITDAGDGVFLYNVPMIAEDWTSKFTKEENFYNEKGTVVRGYEMAVGDIVELSSLAFDGNPEAGKTLSIENFKWKVATGA